ncbi:conserved hypothetical protein [Hyphomicrobiales bacterium]|jgi:hypothetical protein|nr:conserved hypothetical protein [Hyphomicrobiales bacterium]CAH1702688.1 hypothetical protein BOSEA1005_30560 [Hyphomicrobiales bacterium]CAI0346878.1 conserved hypothetical protein [Hyphomicrobiales bacterium]
MGAPSEKVQAAIDAVLRAHRGLATPRGAFSKCKQVAAALGTQLERAGVDFKVLRLTEAAKSFPDADPRWLKLGKPSWWIHYVVEVDGQAIDLTARQFDPSCQHPLLTPMREVRLIWEEIEVVPIDEVWPTRRVNSAPGL